MRIPFTIIIILLCISTIKAQTIKQIPLNQELKIELIRTLEPNPLITTNHLSEEEYFSFFFPVYLNSDTLVDLIYVGPDPSLGEGNRTEIYINAYGSLIKKKQALGTIIRIEKVFPDSPAIIHFIQYGCCDDPHNSYQIWTCLKDEIISTEKYHFLEETNLPDTLSHSFSIRVLNTPYMLRATPEIINSDFHYHYERGNIVVEFSRGDVDHVLSSEKDSTGRIWYFVIMNRPRNKGFHNYSYYWNQKWMGWISSRYVEIIND